MGKKIVVKKGLSLILVLTIFMSIVSQAVSAETQPKTDAGSGAQDVMEINNEDELRTLFTSGGFGKLVGTDTDLTVGEVTVEGEELYVASDTTLDLNGKNIHLNGNNRITVNEGTTFTLNDTTDDGSVKQYGHWLTADPISYTVSKSKTTNEDDAFTTGIIYGGKVNEDDMTSGGAIENLGTFIMNNGAIAGNGAYMSGGGVRNFADSDKTVTFDMYGGKITNNYTENRSGGGVQNQIQPNGTAVFNLHGGEISGNNANTEGGGVENYAGTFNMLGGIIKDNVAFKGGGVHSVSFDDINDEQHISEFNLYGGEISNNLANADSDYCGGGVYLDKGYTESPKMTVGKTAIIKENFCQDEEGDPKTLENLFLEHDLTVNVADGEKEPTSMSIGVTVGHEPKPGTPTNITGKNSTDKSGYFKPDDESLYEIVNGEENVVQLSAKYYTITASAEAGGTINPSGEQKVPYGGENITFTAQPDDGYKLAYFEVDNKIVEVTDNTYTFENVHQDGKINAVFVQEGHFIVTASAGLGGSISPDKKVSVAQGGRQKFTITQEEGFEIADVKIDDESIGKVNEYTIVDVQKNHTISVSFTRAQYRITATAGDNGTITPSGDVLVEPNTGKDFTLIPNKGYEIDDLLLGDISVKSEIVPNATGGGTYTANVATDTTLAASFKQKTEPTTTTTIEPTTTTTEPTTTTTKRSTTTKSPTTTTGSSTTTTEIPVTTTTVPVTDLSVAYNANGGTGSVPVDNAKYEANDTVEVKFDVQPTKEGVTFLGWSKNAKASTPEFTANGTTTFHITGNTTLYAIYSTKESGWKQYSNSGWKYLNDLSDENSYVTNWQGSIKGWEGQWFYFNEEGYMHTSWQYLSWAGGANWFYLSTSNGTMQKGWINVTDGIGGTVNYWYYMNTNNGTLTTGWLNLGNNWYYLRPDWGGAMATGWITNVPGWGNKWFCFANNGAMRTNWTKIGNTWYYFGENGAMVTGWLNNGNKWYYFDASGAMVTGWQNIRNAWYCFDAGGAMYANTTTPDGYRVNENGVWVA